MSRKTDYKRLFRDAQAAGVFYRDQAKNCLIAMNWLLNYVSKLVTPEEFKKVLDAIGAEERVVNEPSKVLQKEQSVPVSVPQGSGEKTDEQPQLILPKKQEGK